MEKLESSCEKRKQILFVAIACVLSACIAVIICFMCFHNTASSDVTVNNDIFTIFDKYDINLEAKAITYVYTNSDSSQTDICFSKVTHDGEIINSEYSGDMYVVDVTYDTDDTITSVNYSTTKALSENIMFDEITCNASISDVLNKYGKPTIVSIYKNADMTTVSLSYMNTVSKCDFTFVANDDDNLYLSGINYSQYGD